MVIVEQTAPNFNQGSSQGIFRCTSRRMRYRSIIRDTEAEGELKKLLSIENKIKCLKYDQVCKGWTTYIWKNVML